MKNKEKKLFQCPVCKLHYRSEELAKQCAQFCKTYHGCSLEITRQSIDHEQYLKEQAKK